MKLNKELNGELSTSCWTYVMLMYSGIVHFYFHEHREFTTIFTSLFTSESSIKYIILVIRGTKVVKINNNSKIINCQLPIVNKNE